MKLPTYSERHDTSLPTSKAVLRGAPAMERASLRRVSGVMPTDYSYIERAAAKKWGAIANAATDIASTYANAVAKTDMQAAKAASQEYQNALADQWYGRNVLNGKTYDSETNTYPYLELGERYKTDSEDIAERILDKYQLRTQAGKNQFGIYRSGIDGKINQEITKFVLDKEHERAGDAIQLRLEAARSVDVINEIEQDLISSNRSTPEGAALKVEKYRTNIEFRNTQDVINGSTDLEKIAKHFEIIKKNYLYSQDQVNSLHSLAVRRSTTILADIVANADSRTAAEAINLENELNSKPITGTIFQSEAEYQAAVDTAMSQTYDRLRKEKASRDLSTALAKTAQQERFVETKESLSIEYLTGEDYESKGAILVDIEKARSQLSETELPSVQQRQILNFLSENLMSEYRGRADAQAEEDIAAAEKEALERIATGNFWPDDITTANGLYQKALKKNGVDIRTPDGLVAGLQLGKELMKGGGGWVPKLLILEISRLINNPRENKLEDIATAVEAVKFLDLRSPPQGLNEFDAFVKENLYDTATTADLWLRHNDAYSKNWTKQATEYLSVKENQKEFHQEVETLINETYGVDLDDYHVAQSVFAQADELYKKGFKGNHKTAARMVASNLGKVWGYVVTGASGGPEMMYMSPYAVHSYIPFPSTENMWIDVHKRDVLDEIYERTGQRYKPNKVSFELAEYHPTDPTYRLTYDGDPIIMNIRPEVNVVDKATNTEASNVPRQLVYAEIKFGGAMSVMRERLGEVRAAGEGKATLNSLIGLYPSILSSWKGLSFSDDIITPESSTGYKEIVYVNEMRRFDEYAHKYITDVENPKPESERRDEMNIQRGNYHFWLIQNGRIAPDAP